jgi:hypothetical protein
MVFWLFSPMYPQYLEFEGKKWYWYHLWHPMDHITAANAVFPSSANPLLPGVYTLIHEHYRNTKAEQGLNEWESNAWFFVEDLLSNYLKKRIVITVNQLGMQAWTLIVNLKDTPQGLKIDNELIIGAAAYGHDPTDPAKGVPAETAVIVNDNIIKPALANWASGADFNRSVNAISRHVVEEFSMFRFFLPKVRVARGGGGGGYGGGGACCVEGCAMGHTQKPALQNNQPHRQTKPNRSGRATRCCSRCPTLATSCRRTCRASTTASAWP